MGKAVAVYLPLRLRGELTRTGVALSVLLLLALLPVVGPAVWLAANVVGIGAVVGALLERHPLALPLPSFCGPVTSAPVPGDAGPSRIVLDPWKQCMKCSGSSDRGGHGPPRPISVRDGRSKQRVLRDPAKGG